MKKIIVLCLLVVGFTQAKAHLAPEFRKSMGGLFGYKFVTTTTWPSGKCIVTCSDPGRTRCKAAANITMPDGPDLTPENVEAIDRAIAALLTPENTSGNLMYGENFFVTYSYNIDEDDLKYTVYSIGLATELGLIH